MIGWRHYNAETTRLPYQRYRTSSYVRQHIVVFLFSTTEVILVFLFGAPDGVFGGNINPMPWSTEEEP